MVILFLIADILPLPFSASLIYSFNKYLLKVYQELGIALSALSCEQKTEPVPVFMGGWEGTTNEQNKQILDQDKCCEDNMQNKAVRE